MIKLENILIFKKDLYKEVNILKKLCLSDDFNIIRYDKKENVFKVVDDKLYFYKRNRVNESDFLLIEPYVKYEYISNSNEKIEFVYFKKNIKTYSRNLKHTIYIGTEANNYIQILKLKEKIQCTIENEKLYIKNGEKLYLNGHLITSKEVEIKEGYCILINTIKIYIYNKIIAIQGNDSQYIIKFNEVEVSNNKFEDFPNYKRSPRVIKYPPQEKINLLKPPQKIEKNKQQLVRIVIPPIVMLIITGLIFFINPRGIYILVSAAGTIISSVFSVTSYINDKKETGEKNKIREDVYSRYLLNVRKDMNKLKLKQIDTYEYNYPNINQLNKKLSIYSSRIYERISSDDDFINISIGKASINTSFYIEFNKEGIELEKDILMENAKEVYEKFRSIEDMPVVVDLKKAHLGIIGEKHAIHEQLNLIFAQLTFFQSYHDIEIICLYDEKYKKSFEWTRWYPHFKIKALNVTGLIDSENTRDQVLGSVYQILKSRQLKSDESKKESRFMPHFIFVIDEPKLVTNHSIMEYLQKEGKELGFTIIYTSHLQANLPENTKTIVVLENSKQGLLVLNEGRLVNKKIKLNHVENVNLEYMSRRLASINHIQGVSSQIPESITFFEMYKINHPEEIDIKRCWGNNSSYKSLAVPLGVRGENDIVYLNLHEKAHGPHGLVAGTTGSGKSEIIQSYILSLAINFHPYEVAFLLIDYKGGGMAGLFKKLPHLLGTITNLDGSESMRALASIKSELARRQQIFNDYEVNHINQYNKLFKSGEAKEPIPHLFLISDEFAELKKEQPDFMRELVSAARVGRSLGIHLILATQKPSGVVDDQIWSNSKFKLALKVQNESDSNEVIKTPDAANIVQSGRAYLQVGNNEIYELFQSAWSGAAYKKEEDRNVDERVYIINKLGQGQLVNIDLSDILDEGTNLQQTELDVLVNHVEKMFNELNLNKLKKPWLEPLKEKIVTKYIDKSNIVDVSKFKECDLSVAIGLVDKPEKQSQEEYNLDFVKDGNLAIFASPGFGKSTTLTTIILSLAVKNSPEKLQFYILDFGNSTLISMKNLPHVSDYINFDDNVKLKKLTKILSEEIKTRKKLFGENNASSFKMYNTMVEKELTAIVLIIDNYDVIRELGSDIEEEFMKFSRDGFSLGIYIILTATRQNAVKYSVLNNFKNKFIHYLFDMSDSYSLIGKSEYSLEDKPGRALVKLEKTNLMQVYSSVDFKNEIEYSNNVISIIEEINALYTGERPRGIRMLPEVLTMKVLENMSMRKQNNRLIPIGLNVEEVIEEYVDLKYGTYLIVGGNQTGKTNCLKLILSFLEKNNLHTYLFDSVSSELYYYKDSSKNISYIDSIEEKKIFIEEIKNIVEKRKAMLESKKEFNKTINPRQFFNALDEIYVIIDDCDKFIEGLKEANNSEWEEIIADAISVGICFIATTTPSKLRGYDTVTKIFRDSINSLLLGNPNEQSIFSVPHMRLQKASVEFGFMYTKGTLKSIQIAQY